jgi:ubiquinone/menaquinone biosynthesis C-methylase UbiE
LELVKEYYVKGEQYDWVRDPRRLEKIFHQRRARETIKLFNQYSRNSKVLDLGCGTGLITRELHGEVLGIDINEWNLDRAMVNAPNANFLRGDCEDLVDVASSSIDTVVLTETLEHLPCPEASLQEVYRVLKPEGKLIVSVPSNSFVWRFRSILSSTHPHSEPFHHNFSKGDLHDLLNLQGFNVLELKRIVFGMTVIGVAEK